MKHETNTEIKHEISLDVQFNEQRLNSATYEFCT